MFRALFFLLMLALLIVTACNNIAGSGRMVQEDRPVNGFNKIALSGSGELEIIQGEVEGISVSAEDNIMKYVVTEVKGNTLKLGLKDVAWPNSVRPNKTIRYTIKLIHINKIKISGDGVIQAKHIQTKDLDVDISGSGKINIDRLTAEDLTIDLSGAGDFTLSGEVIKQNIRISGSGNYQAPGLLSQKTKIIISGSGRAAVWAEKQMTVKISGFGRIEYRGTPRIAQDISGSGKIESMSE